MIVSRGEADFSFYFLLTVFSDLISYRNANITKLSSIFFTFYVIMYIYKLDNCSFLNLLLCFVLFLLINRLCVLKFEYNEDLLISLVIYLFYLLFFTQVNNF